MFNGNDLERLSAYLDGALSEDERAALEARLQTDAALRGELARLRATVDLIKTLPTLPAPRPLTLTPRMVRRPSILTSAAFSALSTAAAIILLVIGAVLFTTRPPAGPVAALSFRNAVAALPTAQAQTQVNQPASDGVNSAVVPLIGDNFQTTLQKGTTEIAQESSGALDFAAPTGGAPQATLGPMLYAAVPPTETSGAEELQADASAAQQSQQAAPIDQQQLRTQAQPSEPVAPAAMAGAAAVALAEPTTIPASPTLAPTATALPTNTPSPTPSESPTLVPTPAPLVAASPDTSTVGVGLIAVALLLLGLAVVTTILRRRS